MSRYALPVGRSPHVGIVVGWDNPSQSFFFQVYDKAVQDEPLVNRGAGPGDVIATLEDLLPLIGPYEDPPPEIWAKLQADYDARTEPTRLQKRMTRLFS